MGMLPPVVATLLADTREYSARMDEATAKMDKFAASSKTASEKFVSGMSKASTAVLGLGVAFGGYALDKAFHFQEGLDKLQNQAGMTAAQAKVLGDAILKISSATGVASPDLLNAALAVEQAGIKGAAATGLLRDASKASVITGQNVVDVTKAIVAAQTLQIAKGMSLKNLTGLLVAGSQHMVGGMDSLANMLKGRVGVALAATGLKFKDIIALGSEFSSVGMNSRGAVSFANSLTKMLGPLTQVHVTSKKTYTTMSSYGLALKTVGMSQATLASDLRTGGLPALLMAVRDAAGGSAEKLQQLNVAVFGSAAGMAQLAENSLPAIKKVQDSIAGAGGKTLDTGFKAALKQIGPQLNILKARLDNLMVSAGLYLLPKLSTVASWATNVMAYLKQHPVVGNFGLDLGTALLGGAAAMKIGELGIKIAGAFGLAIETTYAAGIAAAIGAGILVFMNSKPAQSQFNKAQREWHSNKAGGAYDIAALTANTFLNLFNKALSPLPGHPALPNLPIIGPNAPGGSYSNRYGGGNILPGQSKKTLTINHRRKYR